MILYKLEISDHLKGLLRDKDRLEPVGPVYGVPTPIVLSQKDAIEVLKALSKLIAVIGAEYDYWKGKRKNLQKPILRCLQPAPSVNDSSPFNVFRPSEKTHRPHTRRLLALHMQRRENDEQSFKKLRKIRNHFYESRKIMRLTKQNVDANFVRPPKGTSQDIVYVYSLQILCTVVISVEFVLDDIKCRRNFISIS